MKRGGRGASKEKARVDDPGIPVSFGFPVLLRHACGDAMEEGLHCPWVHSSSASAAAGDVLPTIHERISAKANGPEKRRASAAPIL